MVARLLQCRFVGNGLTDISGADRVSECYFKTPGTAHGTVIVPKPGALIERNVFDSCHTWDAPCIGIGTQTCEVVNNTFYKGDRAIDARSNNAVIRNNIFYEVSYYGIHSQGASTCPLTTYNCFYESPFVGPCVEVDSTNTFLDPLFSWGVNNPYYLSDNSPCIDAGDPSDNVPEGGGIRVDIGAVEYTGLVLHFDLQQPPNGGTILDSFPTFAWGSVPDTTEYGAFHYELFWADNAPFAAAESLQVGTINTYVSTTVFPPLQDWYWKIRAVSDSGRYFWSDQVYTFDVDYIPDRPALVLPDNGAELSPSGLLIWTISVDLDDGDSLWYEIHVDDDSLFGSPEIAQTIREVTFPPFCGHSVKTL